MGLISSWLKLLDERQSRIIDEKVSARVDEELAIIRRSGHVDLSDVTPLDTDRNLVLKAVQKSAQISRRGERILQAEINTLKQRQEELETLLIAEKGEQFFSEQIQKSESDPEYARTLEQIGLKTEVLMDFRGLMQSLERVAQTGKLNEVAKKWYDLGNAGTLAINQFRKAAKYLTYATIAGIAACVIAYQGLEFYRTWKFGENLAELSERQEAYEQKFVRDLKDNQDYLLNSISTESTKIRGEISTSKSDLEQRLIQTENVLRADLDRQRQVQNSVLASLSELEKKYFESMTILLEQGKINKDQERTLREYGEIINQFRLKALDRGYKEIEVNNSPEDISYRLSLKPAN